MARPLAPIALAAALACAHAPSARDRKSAEIHHDLGVEALRAGRGPDALKEFDEAVQLDPAFPEARLGRALVLELAFGKLAEAEAEYREAIRLRPAYAEAHNDLGQLLAKRGRHEEAIAEFDAALAEMLYREPWVARCNKGQALFRSGRREEGIAEMKACLALNPSYCAGHRELGRAHLEAGRVHEALDELSSYARLCEKVPDAHYQLGLARMKEGDLPSARSAFERCEQLGPDTPVGEECRRSRELLQ
jgi:Tfp pilus assembly protein PilF